MEAQKTAAQPDRFADYFDAWAFLEDHPMFQEVAAIMLRDAGYVVVTAKNGQAAIKLFGASFDLVLMDYNMPDMTGCEVTQWIRRYEKEQKIKPVHILGLTANASQEVMQLCLEAGMDGVIPKPFSIEHVEKIFTKLKTINS